MLEFIQKAITSPIVKPLVKAAISLFTYNATPSARAYAQKVSEKIIDRAPGSLELVLVAYQTFQNGGLNVANGLAVAEIAMNSASKVKNLLFTPAELLHDYKNYQFLNGTIDGNYAQRNESFDEEDFVVIEKANTVRAA